jgi:hypothetical protein
MNVQLNDNFYVETVYQFRVMRRMKPDTIPAQMAAEMRINGIDPENCWSLISSHKTREGAEAWAEEDREIYGKCHDIEVWEREEEQIKRLIW